MNRISIGLGLSIAAMATSVAALVLTAASGGGGVNERLAERVAKAEEALAELRQAAGNQSAATDGLQAAVERLQKEAAPRDTTFDEARIRAAVERALDERAASSASSPGFDRQDREQRPARGNPEEMLARGLDSLGLSEDQRSKVDVIVAETREKTRAAFTALREEGGGPEEMRELIERLREETTASLKNVLTDAQMDMVQEMIGGRMPFGRRGGGR